MRLVGFAIALGACSSTPRARDLRPTEAPSPCNAAPPAKPASGPARLDAFLAAYRAAAPDDRDALASRFVADGGFPIVAEDCTVAVFAVAARAHDGDVIRDFRTKSLS